MKIGVGGGDHGASACLAVNTSVCACVFLARLTFEGASRPSAADPMRRRREAIHTNLTSAFSKSVAHTLSHATTQTYSKALTQHALTLMALMMRMGGGVGVLITDVMFAYCSLEEEFVRKGKEKIMAAGGAGKEHAAGTFD